MSNPVLTRPKAFLHGIIPPLTIPFDQKGEVIYSALGEVVDQAIDNGVTGIVVGGSTGEGHTLDRDEFARIMERSHEALRGRGAFVAGLIVNSTREAIERVKLLKGLNMTALQITPVHYLFKPDAERTIEHFRAIYEETGIPILIYNVIPWNYLSADMMLRIMREVPGVVGMPKAYLYFDVAFVIVVISLLLQGWTLAAAARRLHVALPRTDRAPRRVELDLPGQLEQQLVGYAVRPNSLFVRRGIIPSWSKPTLVIRKERILSPTEAGSVVAGDYLYLLAPPEKAEALDRFFSDMAVVVAPDPHLLGDFMVSGEITLGALSDTYGVQVAPQEVALTLADYFDVHLDHAPKVGATLPLDSIVLVARNIGGNRVNVVGLRLPEDEEPPAPPPTRVAVVKTALRRVWTSLVES